MLFVSSPDTPQTTRQESEATMSSKGDDASVSPVETAYDAWSETYDDVPNPTRHLDAAALRAQPFALAG